MSVWVQEMLVLMSHRGRRGHECASQGTLAWAQVALTLVQVTQRAPQMAPALAQAMLGAPQVVPTLALVALVLGTPRTPQVAPALAHASQGTPLVREVQESSRPHWNAKGSDGGTKSHPSKVEHGRSTSKEDGAAAKRRPTT
jgi:hypothetical protein